MDGIGTTARFYQPGGVAVDRAGNVYVADELNGAIRKVTAEGVVTTLAGSPGPPAYADGVGAAAHFYNPVGVTVDDTGNVYVADNTNCVIRKVTPDGVVTTLAGSPGQPGQVDGVGATARFDYPASVAVDSTGNVYVTDLYSNTIRKVTSDGVVTTLTDATGSALQVPSARVAVDRTDNVYIAGLEFQVSAIIYKVTAAGVVTTMTRFSGPTYGTFPASVAVDSAGNLYVADGTYHVIRQLTADGVVTTVAGSSGTSGSADGAGAAARFSGPAGVALDSTGNLYVADGNNNTIRKVAADGSVTTLAGSASTPGSADGTGAAARFAVPTSVAVDSNGNMYVADRENRTLRRVTADGSVTTLAGMAGNTLPGSADGTGAAARFTNLTGAAVDSTGNVYVADTDTDSPNTDLIRKVTAEGEVTTPVRMGLSAPVGVAIDRTGTLYVTGDSTIRKVTPDGVVTTLAGGAFFAGVAVDSFGTLYVANLSDYTILKVTSDGVVSTLAGKAGEWGSVDGTGEFARFQGPSAVAMDSARNIYVADGSTIRRVAQSGITMTVAGVADTIGVVLGTTPRFAAPQGLAIVGDSIVITDANAILRLHPVPQ